MHYCNKLSTNKFWRFPILQNRWSFSPKKAQPVESEEGENTYFTAHAAFVCHNAAPGDKAALV